MDITFLLGTKIIELTLIVLIGYGLVKSKLLKSEDSKPLSIIGLYVISPAVMIEAFQIDYTPEILQGLQLSLLMAVFLQGILIIIGSLLKRLLNLDPIEHATSIYSNSGNLIIPIALLVLIKLIGFVHWAEKGEIIVLISFLATTSPSASTVTQMAVIYNNNPQKASAIYGVTTLLCMFTMPLVIALYQIWG